MKRLSMAVIALLAFCPVLAAGEIVIDLPGIEVERDSVDYGCGAAVMTVDYVNAGAVSLAVFEVDGETVVASGVIAASGARYAGGRYVWWSKGDEATLFDEMREEDDGILLECAAATIAP